MFSEIKDNLKQFLIKLFCHVNFFQPFCLVYFAPNFAVKRWNCQLPVSRDYDSGVSTEAVLYCLMLSSVCTGGKQGREISPSCFCHSQLIPSRPPPLFSWPTGSDQACSTFYFLFHFNKKKKSHCAKILTAPFRLYPPHLKNFGFSPLTPSPPLFI